MLQNSFHHIHSNDEGKLRRSSSQCRKPGDVAVLYKGNNLYGTTVSKSFRRSMSSSIVSVSVNIPSYRVVEDSRGKRYAQYLVVYSQGGHARTVGVWKRYSDFDRLSRKLMGLDEGMNCNFALGSADSLEDLEDEEDGSGGTLPNALCSWRLLQKRKRWFRCLEASYLQLKIFLLERSLHDVLFESRTPEVLRVFVLDGVAGAGAGANNQIIEGRGSGGGREQRVVEVPPRE